MCVGALAHTCTHPPLGLYRITVQLAVQLLIKNTKDILL